MGDVRGFFFLHLFNFLANYLHNLRNKYNFSTLN